jgi:hypothetical protein
MLKQLPVRGEEANSPHNDQGHEILSQGPGGEKQSQHWEDETSPAKLIKPGSIGN